MPPRTASALHMIKAQGGIFGWVSDSTRVLAALHSLPVDAIVTVGDDVDPAGFGPQPAHVRIESYVAQSSLLPRSDLVVCHAGSGSLIGALAYGLPSVLMPLGADQPSNADRCEDLRVARVLDPWRATPADIRDAVSAVLADRSYRRNAERIRDEIASLPGTSSVVALLERLALRSPGREPGSAP